MNELALFAGAGGGILGAKLLGWRTVCAVEKDPYRREVLLRRQRDGLLDVFPIWDDARTFRGTDWRRCVDIVTAGDPCRPYSTAARGRNSETPLWPQVVRIVGEVRPRFVLRENVGGSWRHMRTAIDDLRAIGYCAHRPAVVAAAAVGAPHIRRRSWLFAHADGYRQPECAGHAEASQLAPAPDVWGGNPLAVGMADGVADRMDRISAAGDGQVPAVVVRAWEILSGCRLP